MISGKEIPYAYSFHSTNEYIDGAGPRVRIEDGVLFEKDYFWAKEGWQHEWSRSHNAREYN